MPSQPTRILIVDDESGFTRLLKLTLGRMETRSFMVTETNDPFEVLPLLRQERFDVALLDIVMPKMDGGDLAELIREEFPLLPIGFLTALVSARETAQDIRGFPYLAKPIRLDAIVLFIDRLLAEQRRQPEHSSGDQQGHETAAPTLPHGLSEKVNSRRPTSPDLFPYIVGGLLHDARNTMFATREKIRRLVERCAIIGDEKAAGGALFIAEQVASLDHLLDVIHQIARAYYTDETHIVPPVDERIGEITKELQTRFPNVRFEAQVEPAFEECSVHPGVSLFIVRELLQNAAKACIGQSRGLVNLSARIERASMAIFSCQNSLGEFPETKLDQIQRQAVRPEKGEMTGGRGLYFISEIAKRLGGSIKARNVVPEGAIVEVKLPLNVTS